MARTVQYDPVSDRMSGAAPPPPPETARQREAHEADGATLDGRRRE
jgi:hypothetical protein